MCHLSWTPRVWRACSLGAITARGGWWRPPRDWTPSPQSSPIQGYVSLVLLIQVMLNLTWFVSHHILNDTHYLNFQKKKNSHPWHQHSRPYSDFWSVNFNTKKIDTEEPVISFLMLNIFLLYFDFLIFPSRRGQPIIFLQWWWCWPRVAMTQRPTPRTRLTSCTTRGRIPPTSTHRWMSASAWWSYSRARNPKKTPTLITLWMT